MDNDATTNTIHKDTFRAEEYRRTVEQTDIFNSASGGVMMLESDPARLAVQGADTGIPNKRPNAVRQNLGCGPVSVTDIQARKAGQEFDMNSAMVNMGSQFADAKIVAIRNNLVAAAVAGISNVSDHVLNMARGKTGGAKITASFANINTLLAKMGDGREDIAAFLMPSPVFADMVGDSISNYQFDRVAGVTIYQDVVQAFGRTVIVADIPALVSAQTSNYYTEYGVLGLGAGALLATIVYDQGIELQRDILRESSVTYAREDFDVEYELCGMKWNSATDNPTDAELATAANWAADYDGHRTPKIVYGVFNASV